MNSEMVSIIIPVYNAEKTLEKCINSILHQTYVNIEIILVNDGSTDNSLNICYKMRDCDTRIRIINKKNEGVSSARNIGIESATGEYCCFVDSDDWIEKEHVESLMENIAGVDCVISGYIKEAGTQKSECQLMPMKIDLYDIKEQAVGEMFWNGFIHPCWNKLFKRKILVDKKLYFDTQIHISEDSLFCLRYLSYCHNMLLLSEMNYHYKIDENSYSLSKKVYPNIFNIYIKVYSELEDLLKRGKCESFLRNEILVRTIYPQLYNAVLKVTLTDSMSRSEKKIILNNMNENLCCQSVLRKAKIASENRIEKLSLELVIKRRYFLLEIMWKCIRKKLR